MRQLAQWFRMTALFAAVVTFSTVQFAHAVSAELAKKCRELAIKAHPRAVAGSSKGTAQAERDYFRQCIAKGGNVDSEPNRQQ